MPNKTDAQGGYWEVVPDARSETVLRQIAATFMDTDELPDLHVTLAYDGRNPEVEAKVNPDEVFSATIRGAELFGDKSDILVLLLDSEELHAEHQRIHACGCAKFDFTPYNPHVSLKYGARQAELDHLREMVFVPNRPPIDLLFSGERRELVDENAR
ncbi:hypothetical protein YOLOSWAG_234 [Erwinia phage vB_EamM_Yoloswag]|uniref:Anti-CBASS protein Acb1 n=1 Tax=Erwinia phage vB_EamM_Yoloswag TaxID=1958956 RepID=A0A1S6L3G0_9CAUD|nr:RNA ligase [Erwinia phage vB_EamM_Yoloswag]AQT28712.1 hypothetical protein YOLOSWAG_234 [Erwinia phage vB_EamM_Yoloswag]